MAHITSGCSKLAGTEYTKRHNYVASIVYRTLCAEYDLEHREYWWVKPEKLVKNNHAKILWNVPIQTDKHLLHNRLEIVLIKFKKTDRPHN